MTIAFCKSLVIDVTTTMWRKGCFQATKGSPCPLPSPPGFDHQACMETVAILTPKTLLYMDALGTQHDRSLP